MEATSRSTCGTWPPAASFRRFDGHVGKVNDVRFGGKDDDGSVVVVGGFDGVVRVFDLRAQGAWRPIMELKDAKDAITSLSVSQDKIYSGSVDGVLRCYDLRADNCDPIPCQHPSPASQLPGWGRRCSSPRSTRRCACSIRGTARCCRSSRGTSIRSTDAKQHLSPRRTGWWWVMKRESSLGGCCDRRAGWCG